MRSTSKIRKHSKNLSVKKCEDRISNLPCNLMSHILSFLPTKNAVATCVLSTKWKQSWTSYDSVDFDDTLLLNHRKRDRTPSLQTSFTNFIDQVVLRHRVSRLNKFHLKCTQSYDLSRVNAWIAAALVSSVKELHLSIPMEHSTVLPQDLFSCGTLAVLKLGAKFVMNVPASVHLPNLKILHLHSVKFSDDDSIDRLICGCPVLDKLSMRECVGIDVRVVKISAPMLRSLVMSHLYFNYWGLRHVPKHSYKIVLETPALLFLEIFDVVAEGYSLQSLCHLAEARITIYQTTGQFKSDYSEAVSDFLKGLSNVQRLYLSSEFMEVMQRANCQMPKFHCMTHLELGPSGKTRHVLGPLSLGRFRCPYGSSACTLLESTSKRAFFYVTAKHNHTNSFTLNVEPTHTVSTHLDSRLIFVSLVMDFVSRLASGEAGELLYIPCGVLSTLFVKPRLGEKRGLRDILFSRRNGERGLPCGCSTRLGQRSSNNTTEEENLLQVGEIMRSTSKIRKRSKHLSVKKCEDRISNLPCNLISHILSFLPTKNAVATCVLSTKWKQSWTSYDSVDFDDTLLLNPHKRDRTPSLQTSFTSFIDRVVLLHRVSRLNKFHLKCTQGYDLSNVNAWIAAALLSSVQELHISIPMKHSIVLPQDLFSCGTLVVLKLAAKFVMNVPASVHLPNLKILHLRSVEFSDDESIDRLICGCPVLDKLSMRGCVGIDVRVVKISAPMLTSLVMHYLYSNYWEIRDFPEHSYKIVLETPALLFLDIMDKVAEGYSLQSLCHLAEARITIFQTTDQFELEFDYSEAVSDFLKGLSNVQRLYLSSDFMEVMQIANCRMPKFHCMTYLELGPSGGDTVVWALLTELLENSPLLGSLVFGEVDSGDPIGPELLHRWNPPQSVPSCLLFHLKEIEFKFFEGENYELELLDYFLNNAKVLEKVNVCHHNRHRNWSQTFYTMTRAEGFKKMWMM
ncbi:uncharacterized protein LOC131327527 [Rhododendron vialii]|uniref:uncharacterized protein LOC131327527 n=1 Tax=Rhododendron vialii TaxID=182163 RepID=UPI00265F3E19|nr:uncharacterized protein LOC131327527 [Rhododendron vialii]